MPLLPQTFRPGVISVILFTGIAAAICGGVGTEASSPNRYDAEVDATDAAKSSVGSKLRGKTSGSCWFAL